MGQEGLLIYVHSWSENIILCLTTQEHLQHLTS